MTAGGYGASFEGDGSALELGSGDSCTTLEHTKNHGTVHFKR